MLLLLFFRLLPGGGGGQSTGDSQNVDGRGGTAVGVGRTGARGAGARGGPAVGSVVADDRRRRG